MRKILSATFALALLGGAFSAHAEIATWTNLDGQAMQAEFLGRKGDYVSFRKEDGSKYLYPYAKLSDADRARADALAKTIVAEAVTESAPATSAPATPAARPGELAAAVAGKLVAVRNGSLAPVPREQVLGAKNIAVYYSAHWCPPCRAFTPELVKAYTQIKAKHPDFELVFVSSDKDADAMKGYMAEYGMGFPAIRFDQRGLGVLRRPKHERGIPNLVFLDADGKELSVSYTPDGQYRGPRSVLKDIQKHYKM